MNSKETKDEEYAKGDAEGRKYGYGFFERLVDGNVTVIMGKDERERHEINIKGKIHGADERVREKVEAFYRPFSNKPSSKSESPSTPSEVQYEPSDRGSYDSDDESCYGAGPGVDWDSERRERNSYKCSSSSSSVVSGWWGLIAVIIVGLIIAGIASSIEKKHSTPSKPNYSSAARYYPQSSPVVNARSVKQQNSRSNEEYHFAQANQEYSDTLGKEESGTTQSDGGNETTEAISAAQPAVDYWSSVNRYTEAVKNQSKDVDEILRKLNGGN